MKIRRFMRRFHYCEKGFTLIELLIVVAILGILAIVVVPNLAGFLTTGKVAAANTEVAMVETAALAYYADNDGTWPTNGTGGTTDDLFPGYLDKAPQAEYTFNAFGKVTPAVTTEWSGDTALEWNGTDHEWQKD